MRDFKFKKWNASDIDLAGPGAAVTLAELKVHIEKIVGYDAVDVDGIMRAVARFEQSVRAEEVSSFGGPTSHAMFCEAIGKQFRPCAQCFKDKRMAEING